MEEDDGGEVGLPDGGAADGDRLQSLLRLQDSDCTRCEPSIFTVNGPDLSLQ